MPRRPGPAAYLWSVRPKPGVLMYPEAYFSLFPAFPRNNRAFVAMSFDGRFDSRYRQVLSPAIAGVHVDGIPLEPHRVDLTNASDSILTEILDQIGRCRVLVADLSALGTLDDRPVRNQNVFYEIGLAHAVRLPEEVLLLRSDSDDLSFDISNVRVHSYDPDGDPQAARRIVQDALLGALRELELRKHLAVRRAADRLDYHSWMVLAEAQAESGIGNPSRRTFREIMATSSRMDGISRLLDLGAIRADFMAISVEMLELQAEAPAEDMVRYRVTPFGGALFNYVVGAMGLTSPEIQPLLEGLTAGPSEPDRPSV